MAYPAGQYYGDGIDFYLAYGIVFEPGASDDFLKLPDRKDSISHDWQDRNGIDIDTSRVFFKPKEISMKFAMFAETEADFWNKYNAFYGMISRPGQRRIEISELSSSFYVIYQKCSSFTRLTRIKGGPMAGKICCRFTVEFLEAKPVVNSSNTYLITEQGHFIIT